MKTLVLLLVIIFFSLQSAGATSLSEYNLNKLLGYTLASKWTIEEFEGCEYDKVIRFKEGYSLSCADFGYSYSYNATAFIFVKYANQTIVSIIMVVDGDLYKMRTG